MEEIADIVGDDCAGIICKMHHQLKMIDVLKELGDFAHLDYVWVTNGRSSRLNKDGLLVFGQETTSEQLLIIERITEPFHYIRPKYILTRLTSLNEDKDEYPTETIYHIISDRDIPAPPPDNRSYTTKIFDYLKSFF